MDSRGSSLKESTEEEPAEQWKTEAKNKKLKHSLSITINHNAKTRKSAAAEDLKFMTIFTASSRQWPINLCFFYHSIDRVSRPFATLHW